ncbi:hydroxymethylpyrimidine kinase /phosphomethylpyrimidine kinase [Fulvimarina manganoxydans]|uniref:hydroxymethylpyrimidine kinase n=1 Tax=Fulvimarina manganoxydans TaxID=937218 RepID=A0A1W1YE46_9HYPH|nr:bifunctional hydroxymethylpyrimidine kinase/phosphomethylpyrimidine kinase [Fulvimarina manganoxydans]SMC34422.1 hydroxymethylpyrimidine kinase /phosphomethylpyrimidine kinase [Fulvimarina manganoxydans]
MARIPNVLSIAGSDPSGGAGIQADLKSMSANGAYAMAAITALTAQNTQGVSGVESVAPAFIAAQIDAIFDDIRVDAVKIGMLGTAEIARIVARAIERHAPAIVVLDPVMIAKGGNPLITDETVEVIRTDLVPLSTMITPNIPEAAVLLTEAPIRESRRMEAAATRLLALGCRSALLKGGHLEDGEGSPDVLARPDGTHRFEGTRIATKNTHGTGCSLSSALAVQLALGFDAVEAVSRAKAYVSGAIAAADQLEVGSGHGPTHHFHAINPFPPL